jgi:hypothetical protein
VFLALNQIEGVIILGLESSCCHCGRFLLIQDVTASPHFCAPGIGAENPWQMTDRACTNGQNDENSGENPQADGDRLKTGNTPANAPTKTMPRFNAIVISCGIQCAQGSQWHPRLYFADRTFISNNQLAG